MRFVQDFKEWLAKGPKHLGNVTKGRWAESSRGFCSITQKIEE
jgi:hypothetical protein